MLPVDGLGDCKANADVIEAGFARIEFEMTPVADESFADRDAVELWKFGDLRLANAVVDVDFVRAEF
jgi:hypothetical protein